ncbi:abortive infection family protein [Dysgonomonas macrotermitis]|uniref:Abortive infection C-terminus n=1 Tax=Dysgonomonas macrotermitis TaxID=1346286 RepID=A0A1M4X7Z8_9BACT|nr:abortive infection family protein [Dysgonomonas macrotermitis]SHE89525.1 Abortive infection C-terminus [Dysgonomonas macrotermitis]
MPSFNTFEMHIATIENNIEANPSLCIETCKSLIEGICKTILTNKALTYKEDGKFQELVKQTMNSMVISSDCYKDELCELARRIASVAQKIAEIRNNSGFASHSQDIKAISVNLTLSLFIYKITDVIGGFILHYYITHNNPKKDNRIHFEDCQEFNEYFDEENPFAIGLLTLSSSEALYRQDYEAYKEEYLYYLETKDKN